MPNLAPQLILSGLNGLAHLASVGIVSLGAAREGRLGGATVLDGLDDPLHDVVDFGAEALVAGEVGAVRRVVAGRSTRA